MQDRQSAGIDLPLKALVWMILKGRRGLPITTQTGLLRGMLLAPVAHRP